MRKAQVTGNLALVGYDDIFKNNVPPADGERIIEIPLSELYPPDFHPYQVNDDDAMLRLVESVKEYGVREPGLARPRTDGGYELICGNRRKRACELAKVSFMPVIVRELDDDIAAIIMVDSNLEQREKILPSERAWAYRVMMEALNHNGVKGENHSYEVMVERTGIKKSQIFRIVRLTELVPDLLDKVDARQIAFNPAVELSYLSRQEQAIIIEAMAAFETKPSLAQAIKLKKMKQEGKLTEKAINTVLAEDKKPLKDEQSGSSKFSKYFPPDYTQKQMDAVIVKLLIDWTKRAKH